MGAELAQVVTKLTEGVVVLAEAVPSDDAFVQLPRRPVPEQATGVQQVVEQCGRVWRPGRRRTCPVCHVDRSICLTCDQVAVEDRARRCATDEATTRVESPQPECGLQSENRTSPTTVRCRMSPKTCCWMLRLNRFVTFTSVVTSPWFHFTPKLPFTVV